MQKGVVSQQNKKIEQLHEVATPCVDDRPPVHIRRVGIGERMNYQKVCHRIVSRCLYLARIGRSHILLSVKCLARAIIKRNAACDERLARVISDIHNASSLQRVLSCGKYCSGMQIGSFSSSSFREGPSQFLANFNRNVLHRWKSHIRTKWLVFKKQTAVSLCSTEAEITTANTGHRVDGLPALNVWDMAADPE